MSGPKVWDENWEWSEGSWVDGPNGSGAVFASKFNAGGDVLETDDATVARARLASAAPAMARLLLELFESWDRNDIGNPMRMEIETVLKAAGVLP